SGLALGAGSISAALHWKKNNRSVERKAGDVWARPGMQVTFRAELMPGRDRQQRTFLVKELLSSGRVSLHGVDGEHAEKEFDPVQFDRPVD
ncbi:MAG TPA: hypothetical protein VFP64_14865, partial [Pyrinomonadaceae bacterium]|nr:hypothetical protein [Pyrinomonadaceae bacterium]